MRDLGMLVIALLLSGCAVELLTSTAIRSDLEAEQLKAMKGQVQRAAGTTGQVNLRRAIDIYRAEKGVNPPSLESLVPDFMPAVPTQTDGSAYGYNPATGAITEGPAASGAALDQQTIQQIQAAIQKYGMASGFYPPTLDALVPAYLPTPPRTSTGAPFLYNNQNGVVSVPGQAVAGAAPRQGGGVPMGGGPMGEAMTGIAMQNQLNSMSNAGSASAGTHMRESVREGNVGTHDDMQNKVMDNLGL